MNLQKLSFDLTEMLHIVALSPCLFSILLLLILNGLSSRILVPALFFLALSSTFLIGLQDAIFPNREKMLAGLVWVESIQPAVCFLLIIQLWRERFPGALYWLILALPIVGGTSLVIATLQLEDACLSGTNYCLQSYEFRTLYQLFATALTFLLLTVHLARVPIANTDKSRYHSHRYWLIIALITSFVSLMFVDLALLTDRVTMKQHDLIHVIMRICFLYLVMTSLFRVFDRPRPQTEVTPSSKPLDPAIIQKIEYALREDKLYREMNFNREQCAEKLDLPEHVLSRTINQAFGKNFNEFVNSYRVEEAKHRLVTEDTSITAIAFEVGFSSIASFNRVFKAMVGSSPTEYRAAKEEK